VCNSPTPDLTKLYALSASVNSQAVLGVSDATTGANYWQSDQDVKLTTKRDVFWVLSGQEAYSSVAVMVRKDRAEVLDLVDDMAADSWFNGSIGTGGYRAHTGSPLWPESSYEVDAKNWVTDVLYLEPGETVSLELHSDGEDSSAYLMTAGDYNAWTTGSTITPAWWTDLTKNTWHSGTFTSTPGGWYVLVLYNDSTIFDEQLSWERSMTRADNVWDYLQIIFGDLQDRGLNYVNVASNFFDGSQQVLLPEEVVANGGGNCIDGTLLFAALLENMGVRPVITFLPGHALIGVESNPTTVDNYWPLETTLMGNSDANWITAMDSALDTLFEADDADVTTVYVDEARDNGLTPMP